MFFVSEVRNIWLEFRVRELRLQDEKKTIELHLFSLQSVHIQKNKNTKT